MDLDNYLLKNSKEEEISSIIKSLANAAIRISTTIRTIKPQKSILNNDTKLNSDGDIQKPLDIISDEILISFLEKSPAAEETPVAEAISEQTNTDAEKAPASDENSKDEKEKSDGANDEDQEA